MQLRLSGSILNHQYTCYQKKLEYLGVIQNFSPIAELFLIHPQTLSERNFILFLKHARATHRYVAPLSI